MVLIWEWQVKACMDIRPIRAAGCIGVLKNICLDIIGGVMDLDLISAKELNVVQERIIRIGPTFKKQYHCDGNRKRNDSEGYSR